MGVRPPRTRAVAADDHQACLAATTFWPGITSHQRHALYAVTGNAATGRQTAGSRRLGAQTASRALRGDGTLSGIGAATSVLALTAVVLNDTLGWWWADGIAAPAVAAIAAAEAWHTAPYRQPPS